MHISDIKKKVSTLNIFVKIVLVGVIGLLVWLGYSSISSNGAAKVTYQTEVAEKGTLVVTITGSGTVSTANSSSVNSKATGVVKDIFVHDGDMVNAGDKIAEVDLDMSGKQVASSALSSYQSAKNNVENARIALYTLQSDMLTNWKDHYELATSSTYQNSDGSPNSDNRGLADFHISSDNWLASEAKYKNQQNVLAQAQSSLNSSWLAYQETSGVVYAPISGTVSGLAIQVGSVIGSTATGSTTNSSTKIASIKTDASPTVAINLSEIDIPKIKIGSKANITFDALVDKTFTGKVVSVDTVGIVSSGVTTYPVTILLDVKSNEILTNMVASANIITDIKNDVLIVSSSAIQKQADGSYTLQIMKNGSPQEVVVEIGLASDTQTEVLTGLRGGETVVTATTMPTSSSATSRAPGATQSIFGSFGGGAGGFRGR